MIRVMSELTVFFLSIHHAKLVSGGENLLTDTAEIMIIIDRW